MDKSKKESKTYMKYPAPYSQSWAGMQHPRRSFYANRTASRMNNNPAQMSNEFPDGSRSPRRRPEPQRTYIGQDPTVPHLKYGIFKKLNVSRGPSRVLTVKPSVRMSSQESNVPYRPPCIVHSKRLRDERPAIAKASTVQKFLRHDHKTEGEYTSGPVFVFRPLEPRSLRSLTISPSTHLDIKPGPQRQNLQMTRYRRSNIASTNMVHRYMNQNPDVNNVGYRKSSMMNTAEPRTNNLRYRRSTLINSARSNIYNRHQAINDAILDPSILKRLNINSPDFNNTNVNNNRGQDNNNNEAMMDSSTLRRPVINNLELNLDQSNSNMQNYRQNYNNLPPINYE